jgi:excisionase family DNA binding protein
MGLGGAEDAEARMSARNSEAVDPTASPLEWMTITEAAKCLGLSRWTIAGWIANGALPATKEAGRRRLRRADLNAAQANVHAGVVVPAWRRAPRRAGWRLRQAREATGLTQLELAERSGLTHEAISNLERGRRAPLASTVRRLAQALAIAPTYFVDDGETALGLTTAEAAAQLAVPPGRVQKWLAGGQLAGWKVSGQWRVAALSLAELEASQRMRGRSRRLDPRFRG